MVNERVDQAQPLAICPGDVLQQEFIAPVRPFIEAQFDDLTGQGVGFRLNRFDLHHQLLFDNIGGGLREHRLHRHRRVGVELRQSLDFRHLVTGERRIGSADGIADGYRTVMHAASEVDRVTLLQSGLSADLTHGPIDHADIQRTDHRNGHHQRQNHEESQP